MTKIDTNASLMRAAKHATKRDKTNPLATLIREANTGDGAISFHNADGTVRAVQPINNQSVLELNLRAPADPTTSALFDNDYRPRTVAGLTIDATGTQTSRPLSMMEVVRANSAFARTGVQIAVQPESVAIDSENSSGVPALRKIPSGFAKVYPQSFAAVAWDDAPYTSGTPAKAGTAIPASNLPVQFSDTVDTSQSLPLWGFTLAIPRSMRRDWNLSDSLDDVIYQSILMGVGRLVDNLCATALATSTTSTNLCATSSNVTNILAATGMQFADARAVVGSTANSQGSIDRTTGRLHVFGIGAELIQGGASYVYDRGAFGVLLSPTIRIVATRTSLNGDAELAALCGATVLITDRNRIFCTAPNSAPPSL